MIARALWIPALAQQRWRGALAVAGVAAGVAAVVATGLATRAAMASLSEGVDELAGSARLEIRAAGGVDERLLSGLRDLAATVHFGPLIDRTALCPGLARAAQESGRSAGDLVRVLGVDLLAENGLDGVELAAGADLEALLLANGAALPRPLAERLALAPGDPFELYVRARPVSLVVAGVFDVPRSASAWDRVVVVDVGLAGELYATAGGVDRIALTPRGELGPRELEELAARIAQRLPPGVEVAPPSERREEAERMLRALDFNLTALAGISLVVAAVLVATTLATSVVQRGRQIALLRSLGASRGQIEATVLLESGAIGALGGALGVLGGWLGARAAVGSVRATVATIADEAIAGAVDLEPRWMALGLLLGIGTALAAAWWPLGAARAIPPIQGMTQSVIEPPGGAVRRISAARAGALAALLGLALVAIALPPAGDLPIGALGGAASDPRGALARRRAAGRPGVERPRVPRGRAAPDAAPDRPLGDRGRAHARGLGRRRRGHRRRPGGLDDGDDRLLPALGDRVGRGLAAGRHPRTAAAGRERRRLRNARPRGRRDRRAALRTLGRRSVPPRRGALPRCADRLRRRSLRGRRARGRRAVRRRPARARGLRSRARARRRGGQRALRAALRRRRRRAHRHRDRPRPARARGDRRLPRLLEPDGPGRDRPRRLPGPLPRPGAGQRGAVPARRRRRGRGARAPAGGPRGPLCSSKRCSTASCSARCSRSSSAPSP